MDQDGGAERDDGLEEREERGVVGCFPWTLLPISTPRSPRLRVESGGC
jgi:hypothetical protein